MRLIFSLNIRVHTMDLGRQRGFLLDGEDPPEKVGCRKESYFLEFMYVDVARDCVGVVFHVLLSFHLQRETHRKVFFYLDFCSPFFEASDQHCYNVLCKEYVPAKFWLEHRHRLCHRWGGWVLTPWTWLSRDWVQAPCIKSTKISRAYLGPVRGLESFLGLEISILKVKYCPM